MVIAPRVAIALQMRGCNLNFNLLHTSYATSYRKCNLQLVTSTSLAGVTQLVGSMHKRGVSRLWEELSMLGCSNCSVDAGEPQTYAWS